MVSTDVCIRLKDKLRTFFAAKPKKCRYCKDGRQYIFDSKLTMDVVLRHPLSMDVVDIGECGHCKGTGLVH